MLLRGISVYALAIISQQLSRLLFCTNYSLGVNLRAGKIGSFKVEQLINH
jgi:hypothetical protein